jgi:PAS domain S-box-containing protein
MVISTKRKDSLERLTEDKYFKLIEHAADGIAIIQDGIFKLVNTALARISGYDKEELLGMPFTNLLTSESQKLTVARYQARLAGKKVPPTYEVRAITKDGEVRDIEINAALTEYEGRAADEVIIRDITERKQAEGALRESEEKVTAMLQSISDRMSMMDKDLNILWANETAKRIFGNDITGKKCYEVYYGRKEPCEPRHCPTLKAFQDGKIHEHDTQIISKDGGIVYFHCTANVALRDEKGKPLGVLEISRDITERRRAKEELRRAKEQFQVLVEESPLGVSVIREDSRYQYLNPKFVEMFGYTLKDVPTGRDWFAKAYPDPEYRNQVISTWNTDAKLSKRGEVKPQTYTVTCKDGSEKLIYFRPVALETGEYFVIYEDITERKQMEQQLQEKNEQLDAQNEELRTINEELRATEEELQQSQEKLERMFESVSDGIIVTDLDNTILKVNEKAVQMQGSASDDELLGEKAFKLIAPADQERIVNGVQEALKEGLVRSQECTLLRADGSEFLAELSTSALKDASGNVIGLITIGRDITERKQAEELFKTVINSSPVGIYIVQDRKFRLTNTQLQKYTGYTEDELLGTDSLALVLDEDRDMVKEEAIKMLKGKRSVPYQYRAVNKSGETRWVMETVTSIQYQGRRATLGNYMDITERRQAEEKERQLQQELDLTSRLASIGQLAAGVAHEINNPLTGVIGFSHLLMSRDIPDDMKQDLRVINSEAQRVAKIVENLLTFAHQRKPGREYVDINSIIARVLELRAYEMNVNNIEVETQLAPDLPYTMADAGQLQQVFLNIVLNAEHFMTRAHNRGKLLVKTEIIDDNIRASFTDNGAGISKENLDKVFNPFFTTREVGSGTGLGLSICHGIITQHKGKIYAQSELGQGATFIVELPIVDDSAQEGQAEVTKEEPQKPKGAKILVVDDEPAILTLLHRLLTQCGHNVETINNANSALDRLKTERYSLILLDIKMPGMSGVELYRHIEAIAPALTRRVMFITGDVLETATRDFLDRTKAPHITKPINIEILKKTINHALNQTQVAATTSG